MGLQNTRDREYPWPQYMGRQSNAEWRRIQREGRARGILIDHFRRGGCTPGIMDNVKGGARAARKCVEIQECIVVASVAKASFKPCYAG